MTAAGTVTYEVTVTLADAETAGRFPGWMGRHHIPAVLATGCFESAELARLDPLTFRTRYLSRTRADLDRYLTSHTAALRADFAREFGDRATTSRQVWETELTLGARR